MYEMVIIKYLELKISIKLKYLLLPFRKGFQIFHWHFVEQWLPKRIKISLKPL